MKYKSTRGGDNDRSFEEILLSAYADDGGMWIPESLPVLDSAILLTWSTFSYEELLAHFMTLFIDSISIEDLLKMTKRAFSSFNPSSLYPISSDDTGESKVERSQPIVLRRFSNDTSCMLLDLSLGPTLAFKDFGLQVINHHD